jgi:hypothetical protein
MVAWQTPAQPRNIRRRRRYGRFMSTPRAVGLVLIAVGVCGYGTAPELALLVGLLGLAVTLFADDQALDVGIVQGNALHDLVVRSRRKVPYVLDMETGFTSSP